MLREHLNKLIVLESIRKTGNTVPYPVCDDWGYLHEDIMQLVDDGLLSIDSDTIRINKEGKKFLVMFDFERSQILRALKPYEEVLINDRVVDARIPLEAFKCQKLPPDSVSEHLFSIAALVIWPKFFAQIRRLNKVPNSLWQAQVITAFYANANRLGRLDAWRALGTTPDEATITAERLLNPVPSRKIIQITRH